MKIRILFLSTLLLCCTLFASAQNSLTVADPQWWGGEEPGSIDKATITVEPKGLYMEVGMYMTFSARDLWYSLEDTLEVVLDFNLPKDAIVTDSWLWVNEDIVRAEVLDRWTASEIFEEFVDRRTDPSILFKDGVTQYQLRVFPMAGTETRKVKLNFLLPTRWTNEHVSVNLPFNILNLSYAPLEDFNLLVRAGEEWGDPQIIDQENVDFVEVAEPGLGNWQQALLNDTPQSLTLQFDAPLENGVYVSTFQQGNEKIYQTAYMPSSTNQLTENGPSKKILIILDYHHGHSSLSKAEFIAQVKSQLNLTPNSFFNTVTYFSGVPILQSSNWLEATPMNIEAVFAGLHNQMSINGNLPPLLSRGIEFIKDHDNDGEILLIGSGQQLGNSQAADPVLSIVESQLNETSFPIHIVDCQDEGIGSFWVGNTNYRGNDYFYLNLSRLTNSAYYRWLGSSQSISNNLINTFQEIYETDWSFDFHTSLENGFCYDRYNITFQGQSNLLEQPILQVGKYIGEFPFQIELSAVLNDTFFIQEGVEVAPNEIYAADSLAHEIWVGHFLKELETSGSAANIITQIIHESISERVLSLYTAYLCLEPDMGGETCLDCFDDDDVVLATQEVMAEQVFNIKAFPNPFTTQTTLQIDLGQELLKEEVQVEVYNVLGHLVKTLPVQAFDIKNQRINLSWDARNNSGQIVEQGTYFFVVRVGTMTKVVKVMYF